MPEFQVNMPEFLLSRSERWAMFKGLMEIRWEELQHAYGSAEDVPQLLRDLASSRTKVRERAWYELYGNIWHQGSRYSASVASVPFLFELLERTETPQRPELVTFLRHLAVGQGSERWIEDNLRPQQESLEEKATYEAVAQRVAQFQELGISDADEQVRMACLYALSCFPGKAESSRQCLKLCLEKASDPLEQAIAILALGLLGRRQGSQQDVETIAFYRNASKPLVVRGCAAMSLVLLEEEAIDADTFETLAGAVAAQEEFLEPMHRIEHWMRPTPVREHLGPVLSLVGIRHAQELAPSLKEGLSKALCEMFPSSYSNEEALRLIRLTLSLELGGLASTKSSSRRSARVSARVRDALKECAKKNVHPPFPIEQMNAVLGEFGLRPLSPKK